jgi:hypothetical protein
MTCGKMVGRGVINYPCVVDESPHLGPCMSLDSDASVRDRKRWADAGCPPVWPPAHESAPVADTVVPVNELGQFQGPSRTFAQSMGEAEGIPHPESDWVCPIDHHVMAYRLREQHNLINHRPVSEVDVNAFTQTRIESSMEFVSAPSHMEDSVTRFIRDMTAERLNDLRLLRKLCLVAGHDADEFFKAYARLEEFLGGSAQ